MMNYFKLYTVFFSSFLLFACNLKVVNKGGGVVQSDDSKIECGEQCVANYAENKDPVSVVLNATPDSAHTFDSWSGECMEEHLTMPVCTVEMGVKTGDKTVEAIFRRIPARVAWGVQLIGEARYLRRLNCRESPTDQCYYLIFSEECDENNNCTRMELSRVNLPVDGLYEYEEPFGEVAVCVDTFDDIDLKTCVVRASFPRLPQRPDLDFVPEVTPALFPLGEGPVVAVDAAHNNFHTIDNRFLPFANMLINDGYQVSANTIEISAESLAEIDILVSANARTEFTVSEIQAIENWVSSGGSLLLIVDHPPYVEASQGLALAFEFELLNLTAFLPSGPSLIRYTREEGTLLDHAITNNPQINHFRTATGSAIKPAPGSEILWLLPEGSQGGLRTSPERQDIGGLAGGAVAAYGEGRVAIFAEASGFTAQISARNQNMGMNHDEAKDNAQFTINLIHWLSE